MAKIIQWDFFPLRHDIFTHYKVKSIRRDFGNDGLVALLCVWSFLQEKGGFLDPKNEALIEELAITRIGISPNILLSLCQAAAKPKLALLIEDEKGRYYNEEILQRLGKMAQRRADLKEFGKKGGQTRAKKAVQNVSSGQAEAKPTLSRVEESREVSKDTSITILSTTDLKGDDTKSNLIAPLGASVLLWSPETKISDFQAVGFSLSHTDIGIATKKYNALENDVKKIAAEKAIEYVKNYREQYPNGEPSLTAYFTLRLWEKI